MQPDFLLVVVSKDDVLANDTRSTIAALESLIRSPSEARRWRERVDISFDGYNDDTRELFEIEEVRKFVHELDDVFPFWLFFLSKAHFGLQCILLCFLPPFLTDAGKARVFPERLGKLLEGRWFPAMNHACDFAGMSVAEIDAMTQRVIEYIEAM